jgi:hypothetical protein
VAYLFVFAAAIWISIILLYLIPLIYNVRKMMLLLFAGP